MKPNKELIVNEMLGEMDFGISYTECLRLNASKWKLAEGTFVRYWKEASQRYLAANESAKKAVEVVRVQALENRASKGILSKEERLEILSNIARGDISYKMEVPTKTGIKEITAWPSFNDRKGAVSEINKMEGDYAPIKKDITSKGESLAPAPVFQIILDESEDDE